MTWKSLNSCRKKLIKRGTEGNSHAFDDFFFSDHAGHDIDIDHLISSAAYQKKEPWAVSCRFSDNRAYRYLAEDLAADRASIYKNGGFNSDHDDSQGFSSF